MDEIAEICLSALKNSHQRYLSLGDSGKEMIRQNQFGDTAMKCDVEAEETVLETLKALQFPALIHSEEHGSSDIDKTPKYFGVLDGIDGSAW